ncbi:pectate lyase [Sinorhizobium sp. NFACC03]|uniref:pectate lyase n=1 Tax=Sinorhizobium sp. NFACC03 TaxID=1566295 RepID=UPI00087E7954|nr:pectate lyase [Sinorhizobium sp. NFACC03]SDA92796.1 Pectate lyase [Sinorhizobium sp. NFACC03]
MKYMPDTPCVPAISRSGRGRNGLKVLVAIALAAFSAIGETKAQQLAFPGAEGFGKTATGGRGGAIVPVTSLGDSGPGTLRACIERSGPRSCVFRISGTIRLKSSLIVNKAASKVSILGQTAPGGGILLTIDQPNTEKRHTPFVIKNAADVVVRHVRVRPRFPSTMRNVDGFTVENSSRVYLDHVSSSWATDENFNAHSTTTDLTVANSIFAEGLNKHSKCALLGSDPKGPQNISFIKNACVSNTDRNPDNNHYAGSCVEIVNNVFYNAGSEWGEVFSQFPGGTPVAYVGNYFKAGPSTNDLSYAINWNEAASVAEPRIYETGNVTWSPPGKSIVAVAPDTQRYMVNAPSCALSTAQLGSAEAAYGQVNLTAGAFPRDAVDVRVIGEIGALGSKGSGKLVNAPGTLPVVADGQPYKDGDGDGMADSAEARFKADSTTSDAWIDGDGNGWSNFDDFMNWLSGERIAGRYPG